MSRLLDELIRQRRQDAINYKQYLSEVTNLSKRVTDPTTGSMTIHQALIQNQNKLFLITLETTLPVDRRTAMAKAIDDAILGVRRDNWRGNRFKEREVGNAIAKVILDKFDDDTINIENIFNIAKSQDEY